MRSRLGIVLSAPLVIALMAFAVVAFLFLIDTAINPDGTKNTTTTNTAPTNTNTTDTVPANSNVNDSAIDPAGTVLENSNTNTSDTEIVE